MRYLFRGGKQTDKALRGMFCDPVKRFDPVKRKMKCVVNVKLATALVVDSKGERFVVPRRRLWLINTPTDEQFCRAIAHRLIRERKYR